MEEAAQRLLAYSFGFRIFRRQFTAASVYVGRANKYTYQEGDTIDKHFCTVAGTSGC
jgi:hypothetical protein